MSRARPITERLARFIIRLSPDECWPWRGGHDRDGYALFSIRAKSVRAHRVTYEHEFGQIPDGLVIDHLCRNRGCVNPAHLEAVTNRTNVVERGRGVTSENARKTHCKRGHEFTEENTYHKPQQGGLARVCRECEAARARCERAAKRLRESSR